MPPDNPHAITFRQYLLTESIWAGSWSSPRARLWLILLAFLALA